MRKGSHAPPWRWCMNRSWPTTIPNPPARHLPIAYDAGLPR